MIQVNSVASHCLMNRPVMKCHFLRVQLGPLSMFAMLAQIDESVSRIIHYGWLLFGKTTKIFLHCFKFNNLLHVVYCREVMKYKAIHYSVASIGGGHFGCFNPY